MKSPALIVVGGFAGTGKTAVSKRLSTEFSIPRLSSDALGRTIKNSAGNKNEQVNAYWIAYDLLFYLCKGFIQSGVSTILDLTMGWEFQWENVDDIARWYPQTLFLPIILRCPREKCIERIRHRYEADPEHYDPPELYMTESKTIRIWEFLARLNRPDIHFVDADGPLNKVYEQILGYVSSHCETSKFRSADLST